VGAGDGDGHVYKGVACPWHMQGGGPSAILVTLSSFRKSERIMVQFVKRL